MHKEVVLVLCLLCELIGFLLFLKGFFPIKSAVTGEAKWEDFKLEPHVEGYTDKIYNNSEYGLPSLYRKYVIILIDALRADFVLPGTNNNFPKMEFVNTKILKNESHSFLTQAHPPTVTLPRIKAITSGGIPGFVDVVLNFDSKALLEDNLITQLKKAEKHVVFYGDDTWINLFPDHFARTDGTTSFFVSDYTQVDDNVTRHLEQELSTQDWDVLILHYLGLDHIGHLAGPSSPLVKPKLKEMDHIVKTVFDKLNKQDTIYGQPSLLLVCGDHGMSNQGSHGGSSYSETATPTVFLSSAFNNNKGHSYNNTPKYQIDLAPTLSLLMGVPVPQNSLGVLLKDTLHDLQPRQQLQMVYVNAAQIVNVFKKYHSNYGKAEAYQIYTRAVKRHKNWLKLHFQDVKSNVDMNDLSDKTIYLYTKAMTQMRSEIVSSLTTYDLHAMGVGIGMLWMVLIMLVLLYQRRTLNTSFNKSIMTICSLGILAEAILIGIHISICTGTKGSNLLCSMEVPSLVLNCLVHLTVWLFMHSVLQSLSSEVKPTEDCVNKKKKSKTELSFLSAVTKTGTIGHTIGLLASSFIEEEHQIWYFLTVTSVIVLGIICLNKTIVVYTEQRHLRENDKVTNLDVKIKALSLDEKYSPHAQDNEKLSQRTFGNSVDYLDETLMSKIVKVNTTESFVRRKNIRSMHNFHVISAIYCLANGVKYIVLTVIFLVLCRVLRAWNNTGDKWAHLPDVGDWLVRPENKMYLSSVTIVSLLMLLIIKTIVGGLCWRQHALFTAGIVYLYLFRAATGEVLLTGVYDDKLKTKGTSEARTIYFILVLMLMNTFIEVTKTYNTSYVQSIYYRKLNVYAYKHFSKCKNQIYVMVNMFRTYLINIQTMWVLLMMILVRTHNIALVVMEVCQVIIFNKILSVINIDVVSLTLLYMWMGNAAFFYQGNSNSISTVDVSAGYLGLESYQPIIIGILLTCATYAGPLMWLISLLIQLTDKVLDEITSGTNIQIKRFMNDIMTCGITLHVSRCLPVAVYVTLVTLQRYHLFVWTVFSPKLLYEGMHSLVISIFVMVLLLMKFVLYLFNMKTISKS